LDYQGAVELFRIASKNYQKDAEYLAQWAPDSPDVSIDITFLSHNMDPVKPEAGPRILPDNTYDDVKEQFDILFLPGCE